MSPEGLVRACVVPTLNLNGENYYDLIDWTESFTEPPLTMRIPTDELINNIGTGCYPNLPDISLPTTSLHNIPCHSERFVSKGYW